MSVLTRPQSPPLGRNVLRQVLGQLAEASAYAAERQCDPWFFAVEMQSLRGLGASVNLLRWLWHKGFLARADEVTRPSDRTRKFRPCHNLVRPQRPCFILTPAGEQFAAGVLGQPVACWLPVAAASEAARPAAAATPQWDARGRTLRVGALVVKGYRLPSPNQEAVLAAFQEEGWPRRIDDPLPPKDDQSPKCRLHDTIKRLNRHQQHDLVHFFGDGTGQGACWRYVDHAPLSLPLGAGREAETCRAA